MAREMFVRQDANAVSQYPPQRRAGPGRLKGRTVTIALLAIMTIGANTRADAPTAEPIALRAGRHLFIDDYLVDRAIDLKVTPHLPTKVPHAVVSGLNSADRCGQPYATVGYGESSGRFRLWYNSRADDDTIEVSHMESADGVGWIRPHRVLTEVHGYGSSIIDDGARESDPKRRYKFIFYENMERVRYNLAKRSGLCVAFSPDGLDWTKHAGNPVMRDLWEFSPENDPKGIGDPRFRKSPADIVDAVYDPVRRRYLVCCKSWTQPATEFGPVSRSYDSGRRLVSQTTSVDFVNWTPLQRIFVPDEQDEGELEFYGCRPVVRGNQMLGFVRILRDDIEAGIGYTVLATCHDGRNWTRLRTAFLDRDAENPQAFDHAVAWISDCVTVGDEEYIYYGAYSGGHKTHSDRTLGLARLRRDGFVSRHAGPGGGRLLTRTLTVTTGLLTVNANVRGELKVRVLDERGQPLPGFDLTDMQPLKGDAVGHPVRWRGSPTSLQGRPLRLEFHLQDADLYAFELHRETGRRQPGGAGDRR